MLEIFTKNALCLLFGHQILGNSLAGWWRLPTATTKLTNWMGGEESFEKQSHQFLWELHLQVSRIHSLISTHRVWMLWTRGVEGLEAGDGKQKWIFRCAAKDVGMILYTTRTRVLLVSSHWNPFCFESCNMCSKQLLPGQIWFPSPDIIGI